MASELADCNLRNAGSRRHVARAGSNHSFFKDVVHYQGTQMVRPGGCKVRCTMSVEKRVRCVINSRRSSIAVYSRTTKCT
jgi:hypothetical protein